MLKTRLKNKEAVIGTWAVIPSAESAEIMAAAGMDFFVIDLEHGPMGLETAQNMARATVGSKCAPLVRVPANEDWLILRALEIGSAGVVIPQIRSIEDARKAVRSSYYHPMGERGASPFTRASGYAPTDPTARFAQSNDSVTVVLLVEGHSGIAALDDIVALEGVDVIYIGTFDLAQAAGYPGQPNHPEVLEFTRSCAQKIVDAGIVPGMLVQSPQEIDRALDWGIKFLAYKADAAMYFDAVRDVANLVIKT